MTIKNAISRERFVDGLKKLGNLRVKIGHSSLITFSALILILFAAFIIRMFPLRWEIQTGALRLSEFDPYYQFSLTRYMAENGLISPFWPTQWVDRQRWYPDGINMALSFPALPMTAAFLYRIVTVLGVNIDLMSFCSLFPPVMGTLACLIIYFLGKDIGGKSVGLFSALFLAFSTSFIQRTSLGFFDDETIGIVALLLFVIAFLRANDEEKPIGSAMKYSLASAAALGYFISGWGAALYPIGLTVLFVFILILLKRYTRRLLLSYSLTFGLGLFIAINVPCLSTRYLTSSAVLPAAAVFALLCLYEVLRALTSTKSKTTFVVLFLTGLVGGTVALWHLGYMEWVAGKFFSVIYPIARGEVPLIESVAEHRISSWSSMYFDLGIGIIFFVVGLFFLLRNPNNRNLFLLIFSLTSLYFACSMVRLLLLLAPAFSVSAAIGIVGVLKPFNTLLKEPPKITAKKKYGFEHVGREFSGSAILMIFLVLMANFAFSPQPGGIPKVFRQAYAPVTITAGSLPLVPNEPVQEWLNLLDWTRSNLGATTVVCSWWDYGYWLSILGNVTSLADNATINGTQIENIGFIFMANETQAVKMLKLYDAKYILVFTTLAVGTTQQEGQYYATWATYGDEGKWMWMARISGKAKNRFLNGDTNGDGAVDIADLMDEASSWDDEDKFGNFTEDRWTWNDAGKNSTIYKLMSWGKQRWCDENGVSAITGEEGVQPEYFEEARFEGVSLSKEDAYAKYGGIIPLVCLYRIDYPTQ